MWEQHCGRKLNRWEWFIMKWESKGDFTQLFLKRGLELEVINNRKPWRIGGTKWSGPISWSLSSFWNSGLAQMSPLLVAWNLWKAVENTWDVVYQNWQKEQPRLYTVPYSSRYGATVSAKAAPRVRWPKMTDSLSLETSCVDKIWEQRKNSSGSCKLGQNTSKWNWSNAGKLKRHPRPAVLKSSTTTKQLTGTWDDVLKPKCSMWNPGQEFASKSTEVQTTQSLGKMCATNFLQQQFYL